MKYLQAWIHQPDELLHPMQRFIRDGEAVRYEELRAWNTGLAHEGTEYELFYVEGDRGPYEDAIDSVPSVLDYDLTEADDESFYAYVVQETREEDLQWRAAFAARNLVVVPPVIYDENADFSMTVVGPGPDLRSVIDDLPDAMSVRVESVGEYDRRHAPIAEGLTDRQLAAVEVAADLGFYDVPRTADVSDVADELGVADSTASVLLRKAESGAMCRLVGRHGRVTEGERTERTPESRSP